MPSVPLVSVVIPFYNAERFLSEAVESVFAQSFADWEMLLIDDGSTDAGTEIALGCAARRPNQVRYLAHAGHANLGSSASRNAGFAAAQGEWTAMLDADDVWLPDKLQQQLELAEKLNVDAVIGAPLYWASWEENATVADDTPGHGLAPGVVYRPNELALRLYPLGALPAPCPSDLFVHTAALRRVGGYEPEFRGVYQLYEDQALLSKLYLSATFAAADRRWTLYRLHGGSCSAAVARTAQYDEVRHYFLRWLQRYYSTRGVADDRLQRALSQALEPYEHPLRHFIRRAPGRAVRWARRRLTAPLAPAD
jgi:glycosyltransferase involved in cell wall biosynthesis